MTSDVDVRIKSDEADLLRIQTQLLNPRSNSRLNSDIANSLGSQTYNEEVERHNIAIDMRTMQEMHDTLKDQAWKYPIASLTKTINTKGAKSPTVI